MKGTNLLALPVVLGIAACGGGGSGGEAPPQQPTRAPATPRAMPFVDATPTSNISYVVGYTSSPLDPGLGAATASFGGAAVGDCDRDDDLDLFITRGDSGPNHLYLNLRDEGNPLLFRDEALSAGVANSRADGRGNDRHSGPIFADMDGDGALDLYLGGLHADPSKVYENLGDCTFLDVTTGSGLDNLVTAHTLSAAFGDYDLDGDLDLFLTHWDSAMAYAVDGESEHLFRNDSDSSGIRFANVSRETGVTRAIAANNDNHVDYTLTPTFARINDDDWPDIALVADFGTTQLLLNDAASPGTFIDATNAAIRSVQYGMGSALGDVDFDGDLDWFVTSIFGEGSNGIVPSGNRLLRNPGGDFSQAGFEDVTPMAGVANGRWGWGACFLDIDNDADLDVYHTNGWPYQFLQDYYNRDRSRVFLSVGNSRFSESASYFGLNDDDDGRGVVCADFDNDGDIDILQLTNRTPISARLWENKLAASGRNFLRVRLVGQPPNTEAAGARIFVTIGSRTQMSEVMIGGNYVSQVPSVKSFGLGAAAIVDEVRVEWPALLPGPTRPPDTVLNLVRAGLLNETLVICHPDLDPGVPDCF